MTEGLLGVLLVGVLVVTWIWLGGRLGSHDAEQATSIRTWHRGKIILLWLLAFFILYVMLEAFSRWDRPQALILWAIVAAPIAVITWRWLSGREQGR
jgi:hypothetical protein